MTERDFQLLHNSLRALSLEELLAMRKAVETALAEKREQIERDLGQISGALAVRRPSATTRETLH
jgi:hypothetical protein